jgi:hypothetical protein
MYELDLYEYKGGGRSQSYPSEKPTENPTTVPSPFGVMYGMVLWHSDCQPWLKAFNHFL